MWKKEKTQQQTAKKQQQCNVYLKLLSMQCLLLALLGCVALGSYWVSHLWASVEELQCCRDRCSGSPEEEEAVFHQVVSMQKRLTLQNVGQEEELEEDESSILKQ